MADLSWNTLIARAAQYFLPVRGVSGQTAMLTANTEYSLVFADRSRKNSLRMLDQTKGWSWSFSTGAVTNGTGYPMNATESLSVDGPMDAATTVYFSCASVFQTMCWSYELPVDG